MKTQIVSVLIGVVLYCTAHAEITAVDTELWAPKPKAIDALPVPSDAIVLFSSGNADAWQHGPGEPIQWKVAGNVLSTQKNTKSIQTKESFCDVQFHLEFKTPPFIPGVYAQKQGNSGVFFQGRYEVQILNSYQNPTYVNGQAAAIYKQNPPLVNASLAPGEWQTYDIIFHAPRFNQSQHLIRPAKITALHNGVLVQDGFELQGATVNVGVPRYTAHGCAPIVIQNHGELVHFRNIWVRRLD